MNMPEKDSHWKSLAELLGADVPDPPPVDETAPPPAQPDAPVEPAGSARRRPKPKPVAPPRVPSDWNALAGQLGIELPESPPPPPPAVRGPSAPALEEPEQLGTIASPEAAPESYEAAPESYEAAPESYEAAPESYEAAPAPDVSFFEPDSEVERELADVDIDLDDAEDLDDLDDTDVLDRGATEEEQDGRMDLEEVTRDSTPAGGGFGSGIELAAEEPERTSAPSSGPEGATRRRRKRGRRGGSRTPRADESTAADQPPGDSESAELEPEDSEQSAPPEAESGRRPRRRRRRPTRAATSETVKGDAAVDADADADADEDMDADADDDTSLDDAGRPKHRKIPTWQEAIGVIVDGNLESRAKGGSNRPGPRGQRRRDRGPGKRRS